MYTETVAIACLLMLLFVTYHCLSQIFSADANVSTYPSLSHYHKASIHQTTFYVSLLTCASIFKKELERLTHQATPPQATPPPVAHPRCHNPICSAIDGVIPERVDFGPVLQEKTPI